MAITLFIDAMSNMDKATTEQLKSYPTVEKRLGTVDEIAHVVAFLAEEGSRWINGDTISATGGAVMW
jgi:3-oxoacyl-[acyl-carrier protein] reductase